MKLLFDQNLSPRLATRLQDLFPDSSHVFWLNLDQAEDVEVWEYARQNGYLMVTKDADFSELSTLRGFPPKLRLYYGVIKQLVESESIGILSLL